MWLVFMACIRSFLLKIVAGFLVARIDRLHVKEGLLNANIVGEGGKAGYFVTDEEIFSAELHVIFFRNINGKL